MPRFLIDANLPYFFALWRGPEYLHVRSLNDEWRDSALWAYAQEHGLTIVTKDTDFSDRIQVSTPPPRVIHIKLGNLRMREFHAHLSGVWPTVCELSIAYKLVQVFRDRIEGID